MGIDSYGDGEIIRYKDGDYIVHFRDVDKMEAFRVSYLDFATDINNELLKLGLTFEGL